jgi:hypothetical protein
MFFASILCSAMLVGSAIYFVKWAKRPLPTYFKSFLVFGVLPLVSYTFMPPVIFLAVLLFVATLFCSYPRRFPKTMIACSLALAGLVYSYFGYHAWLYVLNQRDRNPLESLESRLPLENVDITTPIPERALSAADEMERASPVATNDGRREALRRIHEDTIRVFIRSPGFGASRMTRFEHGHFTNYRRPVPQPSPPASPSDPKSLTPPADPTSLFLAMHRLTQIDFAVRTESYFFKSRQQGHKTVLAGEELFVRDTPTHTRVFGSIRAMQQCTACHACERGCLLGAFSYTLSR